MANLKHILLLILMVPMSDLLAQALLDNDSNVIVYVYPDAITTPEGQEVFNFQGNIIFEGPTSAADKIYYTLDAADFFQKGKINIYDKTGKTGSWWIKKQKVYFEALEPDHVVALIDYTPDYMAIYNGMNDSLLAYIQEPDSLTAPQVFALFQVVWQRFGLREQYKTRNAITMPAGLEGVVAYMEPVAGIGYIWIWDGNKLYPAYDANPYLVWEFDGQKLQPVLAPRTHEEWSWDGSYLKPFWGGHPRNEWQWQGNLLRQTWDANFDKEFLYEDGIIRPRFGAFGNNEWRVIGDMPLAIVTAVTIGALFR